MGINGQSSNQFYNTLHPFLFIMFLFYIQNTFTFQNCENWKLCENNQKPSWYWKIILGVIRKVKSVLFRAFPTINGTMSQHACLKYIFLKGNQVKKSLNISQIPLFMTLSLILVFFKMHVGTVMCSLKRLT